MRILLVSATAAEIAPVVVHLGPGSSPEPRLCTYDYRDREITVLVTGVGMVATAVWCARLLARERYDLALNVGICGSFSDRWPPTSVVNVVSDRIAELGAEDGDAFLTVHDLRLLGEDDFPFSGGCLMNASPPIAALAGLPKVHGITVNTAHGNSQSIARVVQRLRPDVESMEGAAFAYACLAAGQPFAQVRAVSNIVERRNRSAWKLPEAIRALGVVTLAVIETA